MLLLAAGLLVALASVLLSRRSDPLWLLDPRGPFALLLFLNSCGLVLYRLIYGEYPAKFGLIPHLIEPATWSLILLQFGFLIGTLVAPAPGASPGRLSLNRPSFNALLATLFGATALTTVLRYVKFFLFEAANIGNRYGSGQWERDESIVFLNPSALAIPTLMVLILAWAQSGRTLRHPLLLGTVCLAVLPSLLVGGRRDLILVIVALVVASAVRKRSFSFKRFALLAVAVISISLVLEMSRTGESLTLADRAESLSQSDNDNSLLKHGLRMFVGTNLQTAVMTVFPLHEDYSLGMTYIASLGNLLLPRFITGRYVAEPAGLRFRELFYSDAEGMGLDYSLAAEAFQNFGMLGPPLAGVLLGALLGLSFNLARDRRTTLSLWPAVHLWFFASALWIIRTDSNGALKLLCYGAVWLLLLLVLSKSLVRRPRAITIVPRATRYMHSGGRAVGYDAHQGLQNR